MFSILTVCTGNICRSSLAELVLRTRLAGLPGTVASSGTYGLDTAPMPEEAQRLALDAGVSPDLVGAHRSRVLIGEHLASADLVLAMARDHRRAIVELDPRALRTTFTVREFARLAADTPDDEITTAAAGHDTPSARLRAAIAAVALHRGMTPPPVDPEEDDVVDPYRRSWNTYQRSAAQLLPAVDQVIRVVKLAVPAA